jgi:PmbA protein
MLIRWLNEEVFPGLTIVDDGTLPEMLFTSAFDDEGSPSRRTTLVDQGVLVGFLYDHKYGKKSGNETTGNAFRENYGSQPHIKPTNICLEFNDITSDLMYDSAIMIHSFIGAHTANAISGDFSLEGRNAFLVENGDMKPLKSVMLYGNVYEVLKNIACFGKDERQVEHTISPSVRIRGMHLSG